MNNLFAGFLPVAAAIAFAVGSAFAPQSSGTAMSSCGCVDCQCPNCDGVNCSCEDACACGSCGCYKAKVSREVSAPAKPCCASKPVAAVGMGL